MLPICGKDSNSQSSNSNVTMTLRRTSWRRTVHTITSWRDEQASHFSSEDCRREQHGRARSTWFWEAAQEARERRKTQPIPCPARTARKTRPTREECFSPTGDKQTPPEIGKSRPRVAETQTSYWGYQSLHRPGLCTCIVYDLKPNDNYCCNPHISHHL